MYEVSNMFKEYISASDREFEIKAEVGGTTYSHGQVVEFTIENSLIPGNEFALGTVIPAKLTVRIRTQDIIPTNAKIRPYVRLNGIQGYTEWVALGEFYIDSRTNAEDVYTLVCYDRLVITNQTFVSNLVYPNTMDNVMQEICGQMGIELTEGTVIQPYPVPYKDLEITIREMLSYIAVAHASNVRITKDGKLDFVKFDESAPTTTIKASKYFTLKQTNPTKTYTRIVLTYNKDGEYLEVGTGGEDNTLHIYSPFMDEALLNVVFNKLNGYTYVPFTMDWAGNPSVEAGDKLSIEQINSPIWKEVFTAWKDTAFKWSGISSFCSVILTSKETYRNGLKATATAPSKTEQKSEFGFEGTLKKEIGRLNKEVVKEEKPYNGVVIGRANGIVVTRSDGKAKAYLNATDGFRIQTDRGYGLEDAFYVNVNGELILKSAKDSYDSLAQRMSTAEAGIIANADSIELRVLKSTYQTDQTAINNSLSSLGNRISDAESSITQNADQIALRVLKSTYETDQTAVNGSLSSLGSRMSTAESSIIQNADNIDLKVSKDGVISSINQSSEAIKIQASKINLTGAVTIDSLDPEVGGRISFIDGNGVFSGQIDVGTDAYVGNNIYVGGSYGLRIANVSGGYEMYRSGNLLMRYFTNGLFVFGSFACNGTIGIINGSSTYSTRIQMYSDGSTTAYGPWNFNSQVSFNSITGTLKHTGGYLGFFNYSPVSKRSVSYLSSQSIENYSAGSSYSSNEQYMLNYAKTAIVNLKDKINAINEALSAYGLL